LDWRSKCFNSWGSRVKTSDGPSECPSLAMKCVALALSQTWTLNLMEKCGQKPMKTPNGHNMQVFHGPVLDHQLRVPSRLQPIPRLGTQLTWKVNCGRAHGAQVEVENFWTGHVLFFPGRS
jgi:hypothetical protein